MDSEVKRSSDAKKHEKVAAVTSANSGDSHQLNVAHASNNGKHGVSSTKPQHASHSTSPQNTSSVHCDMDKHLVPPTSAHDHRDNGNKLTSETNSKKRKRTTDFNGNRTSQDLTESRTRSPQPVKPQRSEYAAFELDELEEQVLRRYATPRHDDEEGATNRAVSLHYNECSLVAISNWVSGSSSSLSGLLVDPAYSRCLVCKKWGHYESECILGAEAPLQSKIPVSRTDKLREVQNDKDVTQSGNFSEMESKLVVETCHGFVFEQRAIASHPNWNNGPVPEGYSAVSTMEIDGSLITSVKADARHNI